MRENRGFFERRSGELALCLFGLVAVAGCSDLPELPRQVGAFKVELAPGTATGTTEKPLAVVVEQGKATQFTLDITALRNDAAEQVDTSFNGSAVITVEPTGQTVVEPKVVKFNAGRASGVKVGVYMAYGAVRLKVTDVGYDPAASPGDAKCLNGKDDDGDGYIDIGKDRGCYTGGDDAEEGGSGATGATQVLHYATLRMADVQRPVLGKAGDQSPFWKQRVTVDRGWLLVTSVSADGFYVTDFEGGATWDSSSKSWKLDAEKLSYTSMFVFNFSTPINLRQGDCLTQIDGAVDEFYGYTELSKPFWKKGDFAFCAAKAYQAGLTDCPRTIKDGCKAGACPTGYTCAAGDCLPTINDAPGGKTCRENWEKLIDTPLDLTQLTLDDGTGTKVSVWNTPLLMTERFESALVKLSNVKVFTEARRCDLNGDQVIDFDDALEKQCSNNCGDSKTCMVLESFATYGQWTVHFDDASNATQEVAVNSSGTIPAWAPMQQCIFPQGDQSKCTRAQPKVLTEVVGTMRHLIFGRPPWTIETRSPNDCLDCKN